MKTEKNPNKSKSARKQDDGTCDEGDVPTVGGALPLAILALMVAMLDSFGEKRASKS
jgi:hypothetical protein